MLRNSKLNMIVMIAFFSTACLIEEVEQPSQVEAGGIFTTLVTVSDANADNSTPHTGALAVLVPQDWSFQSGSFETTDDVGSGEMILDPDSGSVWSSGENIDTIYTTPDGMHWIFLLSDTGDYHDAEVVHEFTLNFNVGDQTGIFPIGYLITVNSQDMIIFTNDDEEDDELAGLDTSHNHMVEVIGNTTTAIDKDIQPLNFNLVQNYPNPFNPKTKIDFYLDRDSRVKISIFNLNGILMEEIINEKRLKGYHSVDFSGENLTSGPYFYKLSTANGFSKIKKMMLIK